ncbi:DUF3558 family protein [Gordonia sp. (in: high G+C Gram-positive bacteria)]|uniref:DUF3558 family protein n=1 Tax=Gordonia sp. (in: high G+C Gram-positive bacteria) TaxID=84139 RepID=UPI003528501C
MLPTSPVLTGCEVVTDSASRAVLAGIVASCICFVVAACGGDIERRSAERRPEPGGVSLMDSAASGVIRQTDARGRHLPFDTKHPHRWNGGNNGTTYEPCTDVGSKELVALGVDASTVRDAAGTDGQTLRGCVWIVRSSDGGSDWSISQIVGNSPTLAMDKRRKSTPIDVWLPDVNLDGRVVGVHRTRSGLNCDTYVQSGGAAVNTIALHLGSPHPAPEEICAKAIEFTRATIGKMPR